MSATIVSLLGYILWMLILLGMLAGLRTALSNLKEVEPNSFEPDGSDFQGLSNKVARAHANCYESFPIIGGLMLLAIASDTTGITDGLAFVMLALRIAQSAVHLFSTSNRAVLVRFVLFIGQVIIAMYWGIQLLKYFL